MIKGDADIWWSMRVTAACSSVLCGYVIVIVVMSLFHTHPHKATKNKREIKKRLEFEIFKKISFLILCESVLYFVLWCDVSAAAA